MIFLCYVRKKQKNVKKRILIIAVSVILAIFIIIVFINRKLDPIVRDIAGEQIKNNISSIVSNTVKEHTFDGEYIKVTYSDGKIASVGTDAAILNKLQSELISEISGKISDMSEYKVAVSFSNIFDDEVIFGKTALSIDATVLPVYSVTGNIRTEFSDAGINQTRYSVILSINVDVSAVILISTIDVKSAYEICIAEMVIVGDVPSVYFYGE